MWISFLICHEAFCLHAVSSSSCIPVVCLEPVLFLIPLQWVNLFCNLSSCILMFSYSQIHWYIIIYSVYIYIYIYAFIQISNVEVFVPEASSLYAACWCVLWCVLRYTPQNTSSAMDGMNHIKQNGNTYQYIQLYIISLKRFYCNTYDVTHVFCYVTWFFSIVSVLHLCVCGWILVCLWFDIGVFSRIFLYCPCNWPYGCCAIMLKITNWGELKTTTNQKFGLVLTL